MKKDPSVLRRMTICGVLAALYAALTLSTAAFAFGPIQFRIADALCVLPFFIPFTSGGLFIGCLIANIFSTVSALDIVIGSLATLIGCLGAARMPNKWLSPLPTIAANTVLVGAMLAYVYTPDAFLSGFITMGAQVAAGEIAVLCLLGLPFADMVERTGLVRRLGLEKEKNA